MCMGARGHQSPTWTLAGHSLLTRRPLVCRWSAAKLRWCVISERRYATRAVPAPRTRERERELAYQRSDGEIWRDEKGKAVQLGELLKSLLKSAASRHQLPAAEKLISSFSTLKAAPNGEEMAHIATTFAIDLPDITKIAHSMLQRIEPKSPLRRSCTLMLQGASNAGDHFATLRLLRLALQQDQLKPSTLPESWKVFEEMKAQRKPSAFRLQAMMDEANGNPAKAEESYDFMAKYAGTRTSADDTYLQQALAGPDGKSINLWIARANFLLHRGDLTGATDCLERGAFEQKDATAHYLRAVVELGEKGHTNKWLYHTCKAAESHHAEAAHLLGIYYGCDPGVIDATALDPDLIGEWDQSEPAMWLHLSFRVTIMRQELSRLWFEKAAKLGSVRSLLGLARAYWTCDGEGGRTTALAALEEFLRYPSASKYWPQTYKVAKELLPLWKGAVV